MDCVHYSRNHTAELFGTGHCVQALWMYGTMKCFNVVYLPTAHLINFCSSKFYVRAIFSSFCRDIIVIKFVSCRDVLKWLLLRKRHWKKKIDLEVGTSYSLFEILAKTSRFSKWFMYLIPFTCGFLIHEWNAM